MYEEAFVAKVAASGTSLALLRLYRRELDG